MKEYIEIGGVAYPFKFFPLGTPMSEDKKKLMELRNRLDEVGMDNAIACVETIERKLDR